MGLLLRREISIDSCGRAAGAVRAAANAGSVTLKADVGCWTDDSDSYCTVLRNAPCVATVLVLDARS